MFKSGSTIQFYDQPIDSRKLLEEIYDLNLTNIFFTTYNKSIEFIDVEYEIQLLIDTELTNQIETDYADQTEKKDKSKMMKFDCDVDIKLIGNKYQQQFDEVKELISPFKRLIEEEEEDIGSENFRQSVTVPSNLRSKSLIIPIKLSNNWTLVWVKFTKLKKLIEMYQFTGSIYPQDKLCFESQQFIKNLVADLFNLQNPNDLIFNYLYISRYYPDRQEDRIVIETIQKILKGYQLYGFNITPDNLPDLEYIENEQNTRSSRTRALPLFDIEDLRDYEEKRSKKRSKVIIQSSVPTPPRSSERKKRHTESKIKCNTNSHQNPNVDIHVTNGNTQSRSSKRVRSNDNSDTESQFKIKNKSKTKPESVPDSIPESKSIDNSNKLNQNDIIVTLDNLSTIKKNINYDTKKMLELNKKYVETYNNVEALLLDKWSRVNSFCKSNLSNFDPPFLIYGPSQIELEILRDDGIIATNTLKDKIQKYNVTLTTKTMRYLTSSRRWINQRFKLNKKQKYVYYTRDPGLIIPDYQDVAYIVMATHLAYGCLCASETFDIIHQNWYISRKMVAFIISLCYKCEGKGSEL